jgi:hypothetical protein
VPSSKRTLNHRNAAERFHPPKTANRLGDEKVAEPMVFSELTLSSSLMLFSELMVFSELTARG